MAKVNYVVVEGDVKIKTLIEKKIVVGVPCGRCDWVIAAKGVNVSTLKAIAKKELDNK